MGHKITLDDFDVLEITDLREVWLDSTNLSNQALDLASRLICREYSVKGFTFGWSRDETGQATETHRFLLGAAA
jgi:hypothetical protein